jgi:hypothetical protein
VACIQGRQCAWFGRGPLYSISRAQRRAIEWAQAIKQHGGGKSFAFPDGIGESFCSFVARLRVNASSRVCLPGLMRCHASRGSFTLRFVLVAQRTASLPFPESDHVAEFLLSWVE